MDTNTGIKSSATYLNSVWQKSVLNLQSSHNSMVTSVWGWNNYLKYWNNHYHTSVSTFFMFPDTSIIQDTLCSCCSALLWGSGSTVAAGLSHIWCCWICSVSRWAGVLFCSPALHSFRLLTSSKAELWYTNMCLGRISKKHLGSGSCVCSTVNHWSDYLLCGK